MKPVINSHPLLIGPMLGFVAGFCDAVSFVGAGGIFCAHVTGNFVVLAADLARHAGADEWLKLATFPVFVLAVVAATWLHRYIETRTLLAVKAVLLALAAGTTFVLPTRNDGAGRAIVVTLLVLAMGVQNTVHRLRPTLGAMTTVMTGNVTQWFVESVTPAAAPDGPAKHRAQALLIAAFAAGCTAGAFGVWHFGFVVLLLPMALALVVRAHID